jgi:hypothetical protein
MSEVLVRRKRVRRRKRRTYEPLLSAAPATAEQRALLWGMGGLFFLAAILALFLLSPGAPGFGNIPARVTASGGSLQVGNMGTDGWGSVVVRSLSPFGGEAESSHASVPGGQTVEAKRSGPGLVVITGQPAGRGRTGFWVGVAP